MLGQLPSLSQVRRASLSRIRLPRLIVPMLLAAILVAFGGALTPPRVAADTNRITNYDFETGAMSGWAQWRTGTHAIAAIDCYNCANHTPGTWWPGSSNPLANPSKHWNAFIQPEGDQVALYQNVTSTVVPGELYHLRAWVSHNGMTAQLRWWSDANGGTAGVCGTVPAYALYPIYAMLSCDFWVPYGTTNLNVQLYSDGSGTYPGAYKFVMTDDWSLTQYVHYDRATAVTYADMWAKARNARYPNFSANDCTNFVSQVLEAAGYPQRGNTAPNYWDWFHIENPMYNHSNSFSWSAAPVMQQYADYWKSAGHFEAMYPTLPTTENLWRGDFFLMRLPGADPYVPGPSHARVAVGYGPPQEGTVCPNSASACTLGSQHSPDRYRVPVAYMVPDGTPVWLWHVTW